MPDKRWTAIFGVLVMLVAAVGPTVGAAAPTGPDATTAIDDGADFAIDSDLDDDENESDDDENESDDDENESDVDGNESAFNATSSTAAANAFVEKLHQVVANATNDTNVSAPGRVIASYVVANNPGNAPDHAGPPNGTPGANATNTSDGGPPEGTPGANATNGSSGGPPNGTPGGAPDGNETDGSDGAPGNGGGNGNGPKQVAATDAAADFAAESAFAVSATPFDA
jgi:hypothetical protein